MTEIDHEHMKMHAESFANENQPEIIYGATTKLKNMSRAYLEMCKQAELAERDLLVIAQSVASLSAYDCPFCEQDKITLQTGADHNCEEVRVACKALEGRHDEQQ